MHNLDPIHIPKNISYNLWANIFTAIILFCSLPIYSKIMDPNDFGFFCFVFVLLTILKILDFGFSATLTRFISKNYNSDFWKIRSNNLIFTCEIILLLFPILIFIFFLNYHNLIINYWINFDKANLLKSDLNTYNIILIIFSPILYLKLLSVLYKGIFYGIGEQPKFNIIRFIFEFLFLFLGIICYIYFASILILYIFYLIISLFEIILYKKIIKNRINNSAKTSFKKGFFVLLSNKYFFLNIALTNFIWLISSNLDKILFSNIINIDLYGSYTIITTLALLPLLIFVPIFESAFPNLNNLYYSNQRDKFEYIYNILVSLCLILFYVSILSYINFGNQFWYYLFDSDLKQIFASSIFLNFFLGYFFLSFSYIIFTFLKIRGKLKIHSISSIIWCLVLIYTFYIAIFKNKNPLEYSLYWLNINMIYFILFSLICLFYFNAFKHIIKLFKKNLISLLIFLLLVIFSYSIDLTFTKILYLDLIYLSLSTLILILIFMFSINDLRKITKELLYNKLLKTNRTSQ